MRHATQAIQNCPDDNSRLFKQTKQKGVKGNVSEFWFSVNLCIRNPFPGNPRKFEGIDSEYRGWLKTKTRNRFPENPVPCLLEWAVDSETGVWEYHFVQKDYVLETSAIWVCVECLNGKQKKPILFKVTEPSSVPYSLGHWSIRVSRICWRDAFLLFDLQKTFGECWGDVGARGDPTPILVLNWFQTPIKSQNWQQSFEIIPFRTISCESGT